VLKADLLWRTLVGSVEREGGSRDVRPRPRLRRSRPGGSAGKAAKRENELGREGSRCENCKQGEGGEEGFL
jgi:hypothetical protein